MLEPCLTLAFHFTPPPPHTTQDDLARDNYFYIGTNIKECLSGESPSIPDHHLPIFDTDETLEMVEDDTFWPSLIEVLDAHRPKGHNVIYSFEWLSEFTLQDTVARNALLELKKKWNVHIVTGYRHFHEWLPSLYVDVLKNSLSLHPLQDTWPDEGGPEMLPILPDCFTNNLNSITEEHMKGATYLNSLHVYATYFELLQGDVEILDCKCDDVMYIYVLRC